MFLNARLATKAAHQSLRNVRFARGLNTTLSRNAFQGSKPKDHVSEEQDSHNVQRDAAKEGKDEKASGKGSIATTERDLSKHNEKAMKDTKAPGVVIGMNDERGGKGR